MVNTEQNPYLTALSHWASAAPNREAIIDNSKRITYAHLENAVNNVAVALQQMDIGKNDLILTALPNWYEYAVVCLAAAKIGAIFAPTNGSQEANELSSYLDATGAKIAFVGQEKYLSCAMPETRNCRFITVRFSADGVLSFEDLLEAGGQAECQIVESERSIKETGMIIFTSGSSGVPKGCEISYYNTYWQAKESTRAIKTTENDVFLAQLPLYHYFGLATSFLEPLRIGAKIILLEKYLPEKVLDVVESENVSVITGVPTMFIRMVEEQQRCSRKVDSIRVCYMAGALCEEGLVRTIRSMFSCHVLTAYGATEIGIACTTLDDDPDRVTGTCGKIYEDVEYKVLDDSGNEVAPGVPGKLYCKSPYMFKKYFNNPKASSEKFTDDGWLITQDIARVDKERYITVLGRWDDAINRGGEKVFPIEVEGIYYHHPEVCEIVVVGTRGSALGEEICAYIRLEKGSSLTEDEMKRYALEKISKNKIPDKIIFLKDFPKLANGKIDRLSLRQGASF